MVYASPIYVVPCLLLTIVAWVFMVISIGINMNYFLTWYTGAVKALIVLDGERCSFGRCSLTRTVIVNCAFLRNSFHHTKTGKHLCSRFPCPWSLENILLLGPTLRQLLLISLSCPNYNARDIFCRVINDPDVADTNLRKYVNDTVNNDFLKFASRRNLWSH